MASNVNNPASQSGNSIKNPHLLKLVKQAETSQIACVNTQDINKAQNSANEIKRILIDSSDSVQQIAKLRDTCRDHLATLRKANPKGKPTEGEVRVINGQEHTFMNGKFYPIEKGDSEQNPQSK